MANKNFSEKLKSFAEAEDEVNEFKVTIKLPNDKVADAGLDIMNELKDSNIEVMNQDYSGENMILTLRGKIDKKSLRTLIKEACYGNEMKRKDFTLVIE